MLRIYVQRIESGGWTGGLYDDFVKTSYSWSRHHMLRRLFLMSLVALGALASGVGGALAQDARRLTFSWHLNAGPLDPRGYGPSQMYAQAMVFEPLVRLLPDGAIGPGLATSWEVSGDGKTYAFHLRPNVRFANGAPLDAAVVAANFQHIIDNRDSHAWLELARRLVEVRAVGPLTVRLTLAAAYEPTLRELALPRPFRIGSMDSEAGTGPWMRVESAPGERDVFVRNPHYWGEPPAYEEIDVRVIPDVNARLVAFQTGMIDLLYGPGGQVTSDTFARLRDTPGVTTRVSRPMETSFIALNSAHGPTRDLRVRRAIAHAINKEPLVNGLLGGGRQVAGALFAPSTPYADIGLTPLAYDLQRARRLLDEAGWIAASSGGLRMCDGVKLETDLVFAGGNASARMIAEVVQADLARIGVQVRLVGEDDGSVAARERDGRFGMVLGATWGAPYDPHAYLASMRAPAHADFQAQAGLADKQAIDQAISAALEEGDAARRADLYRDVLTRLHDSAIYVPLAYVPIISQGRDGVDGAPFPALLNEIPFDQMGRRP